MKVVLEAVPVLLFLLASFSLLSLLVMLPVAMFAPAKFTKSFLFYRSSASAVRRVGYSSDYSSDSQTGCFIETPLEY